MAIGGDSSWFEECVFTGDSVSGALSIHGADQRALNCVFGPIDTCTSVVLYATAWPNARNEGNTFHSTRTTNTWYLAHFGCSADGELVFCHNYIAGIHGNTVSGMEFDIANAQLPLSLIVRIDSNVFADNTQSTSLAGKALELGSSCAVTGNRFIGLAPSAAASVLGHGFDPAPVSELRHNQFEAADYALNSPSRTTDAIRNFWGHPSGPFNAVFNPNGQGAGISSAVLFDPWSPDTNFFPDMSVSADLRTPLPGQFEFSGYPNPFNSIVHFTLTPADVQLVTVKLYDVLGREVAEVWRGPLAFRKEIDFDASGLASGIYFVRVADTISRKQMAMQKLVLLK